MTSNLHPADELHDVRAKIKALEEREAELRVKLTSGECSLVGDAYTAWIAEHAQTRLDAAAAQEALGKEALAPFMRSRRIRQVRLAARRSTASIGSGKEHL
jgi:hypothetical protein